MRQYADDTLGGAKNTEEARLFLEAVQTFERASAAALNVTKCRVLLLPGSDFPVTYQRVLPNGSVVEQEIQPLKDVDYEPLLGMKLNPLAKQEGLLDQLEEKVRTRISTWKGRNLTLTGRALAIRSSICSILWYLWTFVQVTDKHIKRLEHWLWEFFWKKSPQPIARSECL